MKKSALPGQEGVRQPRAGRVGKVSPPAVAGTGVKLTPPRKGPPVALLKEQFTDSEICVVSFAFISPTAREVLVAGSFNDWQPDATPMSKQHAGNWATEILLKPGRYEYRLVVDGQWQDDPMAARFVANPFGGLNGVVEVKATAAPPQPVLEQVALQCVHLSDTLSVCPVSPPPGMWHSSAFS